MGLALAFKAFIKALKEPKNTEAFLSGKAPKLPKKEKKEDPSHLQLLSLLQQSSRLVDFLQEDIAEYSDAQIGAAVRQVHADSAKTLEELVTIRPVMEEPEGARIHVPKGYDPAKIKIVGSVKGEGPYEGVLVHKGWRAHKKSLPKKLQELQTQVICAAEVEVKA